MCQNPNSLEVRTTSGFSVKSGVRGSLPKDLWFSVSPKENSRKLAGMPQLFMIVSDRGIEYGFGASVSPSDFSNKAVKDLVRAAAPIVFSQLPSPDSAEATSLHNELETHGTWYFRRKHRLPPNQKEFPALKDWLQYLHSPDGKKSAAGTISKYLAADEVDGVDLEEEMGEMARLFQPLIDRDWQASPNTQELDLMGSNEFSERLSEFLRCFGEKRTGSFGLDPELSSAMKNLREWLELVPAVSSRPSVKVTVSAGKGGWTNTPWIALLDSRETQSTQRGTYIVFLIEDASSSHLRLIPNSESVFSLLLHEFINASISRSD